MTGAILVAAALALGSQTAEPRFEITHRARSLAPGEVVVVAVHASERLQDVEGRWLGERIPFFAVDADDWQGLVPIDLEVRAGRQMLAVTIQTAAGRRATRSYPIEVAARTFPARRITVDPKFVDPPPEALPRIEKERLEVAAIFAAASPERYWSDPFTVPVPGEATSSFGRRSIVNGQPRSQHSGTDFQAATGTPVVAPNRGRVVLAADHYFSGRTIVIDHGLGLYSFLAHLSEMSVASGTMVERGQRIGLSGMSGRVTGPHLHWTMRIGRARVDPLSLVETLRKTLALFRFLSYPANPGGGTGEVSQRAAAPFGVQVTCMFAAQL